MAEKIFLLVLGNCFILAGGLIIADELWLHIAQSVSLIPGVVAGLGAIVFGNCCLILPFRK